MGFKGQQPQQEPHLVKPNPLLVWNHQLLPNFYNKRQPHHLRRNQQIYKSMSKKNSKNPWVCEIHIPSHQRPTFSPHSNISITQQQAIIIFFHRQMDAIETSMYEDDEYIPNEGESTDKKKGEQQIIMLFNLSRLYQRPDVSRIHRRWRILRNVNIILSIYRQPQPKAATRSKHSVNTISQIITCARNMFCNSLALIQTNDVKFSFKIQSTFY